MDTNQNDNRNQQNHDATNGKTNMDLDNTPGRVEDSNDSNQNRRSGTEESANINNESSYSNSDKENDDRNDDDMDDENMDDESMDDENQEEEDEDDDLDNYENDDL